MRAVSTGLTGRMAAVVLGLVAFGLSACDTPITLPDAGPALDAGAPPDAGPPMTCDNGTHDGDESSVDCGGSCPPCVDGEPCHESMDCRSGVCGRSRCLVATCRDGVRNGMETGVDCGGTCGLCGGGETCTSNEQCISGRCRMGMCTMSSCEDAATNNGETDVDCGGPTCPACTGGYNCSRNQDCESLICSMGVCTDAACNDGIQNQDESSVDCGGSICPACRDGLGCGIDADCIGLRCYDGGCVSCMDRIRNAEETDEDCGGGLCPTCSDGDMCTIGADCTSGSCVGGVCQSCMDGVMNQDETDVDCGGALCPGCADGDMCTTGADCLNPGATCEGSLCVSCADRVRNRDETDVDCGGSLCSGCAPGLMCTVAADCASMICDGATMRCNAPGCGDGILNGGETSVDCGGGSCLGCNVGQTCVLGRDCLSGVCTGGTCQAPTCMDGVANGGETDVDCGGSTACPRCPDYDACVAPSDCITAACTMGRCGTTGCIPFPGGSTDPFGYFGCTIPLTPTTLPCPDISTTGTIGPTGDDGTVTVPMGFNFDFYGTSYGMMTISTNGAVAFDSSGIGYSNSCLPLSFSPLVMIMPYWDDLYPPSGGSVRYQTLGSSPNRQFVVRWNVPHISGTGDTLDVTLVLNETSGDIETCYRDVDFGDMSIDRGASATVGISATSANRLQFSCNTASLSDGLYVQYVHP
ncbi:MAG: hypothetical protein AB7S26_29565 [Sandaracinaceae bacterium]